MRRHSTLARPGECCRRRLAISVGIWPNVDLVIAKPTSVPASGGVKWRRKNCPGVPRAAKVAVGSGIWGFLVCAYLGKSQFGRT